MSAEGDSSEGVQKKSVGFSTNDGAEGQTSCIGEFFSPTKKSNELGAIMNTLKSMVGSGYLGLPYGFLVGGWAISLIGFVVICFASALCMGRFVKCKEGLRLTDKATFMDLGRGAFGKPGTIVLHVILFLDVLGTCMGYMMFISETLHILVDAVGQEFWALIWVIVFMFLSFFKNVKIIGIFSLIANFLIVVGIILLIVAVSVAGIRTGSMQAANWSQFPVFFGIVLFAYQAGELVIPVHNSMQRPKHYKYCLWLCLAIVCLLYSGLGFGVYAGMAQNTPQNVLNSISNKYNGLKISLSVILITTITITMQLWLFPLFELVDKLFDLGHILLGRPSLKEKVRDGDDDQIDDKGYETDDYNTLSSNIELPSLSTTPNPSPSTTPTLNPQNSSSALETNSSVNTVYSSSESTGSTTHSGPVPVWKTVLYYFLNYLFRFLLLIVICIPSLIRKIQENFSLWIGLNGTTTGVLISFILPLALHIKICWTTMTVRDRVLDIVGLCLLIPASIVVLVFTIIDLADALK